MSTNRGDVAPSSSDLTCDIAPPPAPASHQTMAFAPASEECTSAVASDHTCVFGDAPPPPASEDRPRNTTLGGATQVNEPVLEGVTVPGYLIMKELGRGGMGVVYKARHLRLQRLVALKMVLAGAHAGTTGLARFRAEAEAVARLQHPNIIQIFETGEHDGMPYFSLEFAEEGSLEDRMRESPLTPKAAAGFVEALARAMEVAHHNGIVHRDLKPANILLAAARGASTTAGKTIFRNDPRAGKTMIAGGSLPPDHWVNNTVPKIADFGLAKRLDDNSGNTQTGAILGTPSYMSPEQAEGRIHDIGPATDIYALGAILYELLTGRPPFKANSPIDTIRQLLTQEPVAPRQLEPGVPADLETICLKCLEKDPGRRYASSAELGDDLRRFVEGEPIRARPTPAWELAWKWGKRRPAILALLAVSLLAVVSVVFLIIYHNATLQTELDQARLEERQAREREQEALENERTARLEAESEKLLHDAEVAAAARDWSNARLHLTRALATLESSRVSPRRLEKSQTLLAQAEKHLQMDADRKASKTRFEQFASLRDEALFLGCLYTGMDLAANLKATRTVVHKALAVYDITPQGSNRPDLDSYLDATQKSEILADCYQLLLILAETEAEKPGEAVRLLQQALRFGPPSRAYHLRHARYLGALGDTVGVQREEQAATRVAVSTALDHFLVGDEYYRRGQFTAASASFNQVLQQRPAHFWAQYLNALCLLRQRKPAEARAQLSACLAQRTDFVWLYLLRGFAQGELSAFEAAEADFQRALQMPLDEFSRYVLFVNRGVLRVRQERFADAIADLKTAIDIKPQEYQAHVNLAQAYRQSKKLDLALTQMNRAVELEPGLAHLYRLRARLHLERKELGSAQRDYEQTIRRESSDSVFLPDDHVEYGRLLLGERKYREALTAFDAALRLRKDHLSSMRLRADALFHLGRYSDAVTAFDRYLDKGKPLEAVYRGRGLARAELGKYPGAIEDYTKALELQPSATVQTYRGWAHLLCEAPKLALRDFELALELDPKHADAHAGRGLVLAQRGQYREAVRDGDEALRHGPLTPRLLFNVARIHAQCPLSLDKSQARAMELLQQALAALPADQRAGFWTRYIAADATLGAVRRTPEFARLEKSVLGKSSAGLPGR